MISKISFGSTFKISSSNNDFKKFQDFKSFALEKRVSNGIFVETKDKMENKYPYNYTVDCTIVTPNYMDNEIETYCTNNGIQYTKRSPLMTPEALSLRVADAPQGTIKATVNTEKLEKII